MKHNTVVLQTRGGNEIKLETGTRVRPSDLASKSGVTPAMARYMLRRENAKKNRDGTWTVVHGRVAQRHRSRR